MDPSLPPPPPPPMVPSASIPPPPPPTEAPPPPPPAPVEALAPPPPPPAAPKEEEPKPVEVVVAPQAAPAPAPKQVLPEPDCAANDWQTGFCWAFIVKFHHASLIGRGGISNVLDLENGLHTEGHSEVLSTILQRFVLAFKPLIKDMKDKTLPKHLVRTIDTCLGFTSMSVYHDCPAGVFAPAIPLPTGEKDEADRKALNPLRKMFQANRRDDEPSEGSHGGEDAVGSRIWEMDWRERLKLLRQLVDWQLAHSESIRQIIQDNYKMGHQKQTDFNSKTNPLIVQPIGQDRKKKRYWAFDDSPRIYTSTNPYKKQCPLTPATSTKDELLHLIEEFRQPISPTFIATQEATIAAGGPAAKKAKSAKNLEEKGKAVEVEMARWLEEEHLPLIEKEEARLDRARKKQEQMAIAIAQADVRTSRTRRSTRKPDYVNGGTGNGDDDDDGNASDSSGYYSSSSNRNTSKGRTSTRAASPEEWRGERRSTRVSLSNNKMAMDEAAAAEQDPSTMIPFPPSPEPEPASTNAGEEGAVEKMEGIVEKGDSAASLAQGGSEIKEEGMSEVGFGGAVGENGVKVEMSS